MKITNQFTPKSIESPKWEKTEDGFLRCKARILIENVMPYAVSELESVPEEFKNSSVNMYVPIDEMSSEMSLRSLEGMPVVAGDHTWMTPELMSDYAMGNVSGIPTIEGNSLICNLLITNPDAINAIENGKIGEISGAYRAETEFVNGQFNDKTYDAIQKSLVWNHIAVIPKGHGRGGNEVRILNRKQEEVNIMADEKKIVRVKLRNTGKYVNTDDDGATAIEAESTATDEVADKKGADLSSLMDQLEALKAEVESKNAEMEQVKGELSVYKEKLDQLLSDESVESAADGMIEENGEANDIIENEMPVEESDEEKKKEKEEFKNSLKKVHGTKLYAMVLNAIGVKTESMSPEALKGAFKAQHQICNKMRATGKKVAGTGMFQNKDGSLIISRGNLRTPSEKLGYKK